MSAIPASVRRALAFGALTLALLAPFVLRALFG
jgi:hypothetical protein